jgi:O-antigen/teichoic acid export membrane protein
VTTFPAAPATLDAVSDPELVEEAASATASSAGAASLAATDSTGTPQRLTGIARHSMIYAVGTLLSKAVAFVMLPVYTRYLTPGDYGVMELIGMTLDIIAMIAGAGMAAGIFRYFHKAETEAERNAVVSTAMQMLAASYLGVAAIAFAWSGTLSRVVFGNAVYGPLVRIGAETLAFQSLMMVSLAYIRVQHRSVGFVFANLSKLVLALSLNIYFVVFLGMGVRGVLLSTLISTAAVGLVLTGLVVREVGFAWSMQAGRNLFRYGVPLIGTQFATFIATFGDRYFLEHASNVAAVGIYTLAYQFGFMLSALGYTPLEMVWIPARFSIAKRVDRDDMFARTFVYLNVWFLSVAVGITLFIGDVLHVMTTPAFYSAAVLVPIILVAYVFQGWATIQDIGIHEAERTEFITVANWLSAATAVIGYVVLIPRYFALGAAIATVAAFAVRWAATYYFSQRLWHVRYRWTPVLRQVAIGVVVCVASILMPPAGNVFISLVRHAMLFLAYAAGLWTLGVLSIEERAEIRTRIATARRSLLSRAPSGTAA